MDPDDLNRHDNEQKPDPEPQSNNQIHSDKPSYPEPARAPSPVPQDNYQSQRQMDEQLAHLDAGNLVSQLVDDDDFHQDPEPPQPSYLEQQKLEQEQRERMAQQQEQQRQEEQQRLAREQQQQEEEKRLREQQAQQLNQQQQQPSQDQVPSKIEWMYLDPQGNTQGSFSTEDMLEWYGAGYFAQELMLRRTCDERFLSLGDMRKLYDGQIPFVPGVQHPPPLRKPQQQQPEPKTETEKKIDESLITLTRLREQQQIYMQQIREHQHVLGLQAGAISDEQRSQLMNNMLHTQQQLVNLQVVVQQYQANHHQLLEQLQSEQNNVQMLLEQQQQQQLNDQQQRLQFNMQQDEQQHHQRPHSRDQPGRPMPFEESPAQIQPPPPKEPTPPPQQYDAIQSLLTQLQAEGVSAPQQPNPQQEESPRSSRFATFGNLVQPQHQQAPNASMDQQRSIWDLPPTNDEPQPVMQEPDEVG